MPVPAPLQELEKGGQCFVIAVQNPSWTELCAPQCAPFFSTEAPSILQIGDPIHDCFVPLDTKTSFTNDFMRFFLIALAEGQKFCPGVF